MNRVTQLKKEENNTQKDSQWMDVVVNTNNPNSWKVEAGKSRVQGQPYMHGKFEASLAAQSLSQKPETKMWTCK